MTTLTFEPSNFTIDVTAGARIVDVCDDNPRADVPFSCRSASCGTCRVEVARGGDAFPRPEEDEQAVLDLFGDPPGIRLACQLKVVRDVDAISLRVLEP